MSAADDTRAVLARRWTGLAPRERLLVGAMGGALAVLLAWLVAVRPAWRMLDAGPAARAQADLALLQVRALGEEAKQLRATPPVPPAQAEQVLKSATDGLGGRARLSVQADRATLTLIGASGEDLRQWLLQARGGARARPVQAALTRAGDGYNGTVVVAIGQSQ